MGRTEQSNEQWQGAGRSRPQQAEGAINVNSQERLLSAGAGLLLTLYGLKRMRLGSILLAAGGVMLLKRATTGHCDLYAALGLNSVQGDGAAPEEYFERGIHVEESFTINKPAAELYGFWRKFENLPKFMRHLESVQTLDGKRSHWVARGPMGMSVKWEAEIINDEPNELIAWRSLAGADVDNAGSVSFKSAPGDRGTEVSVTMDYIPPAGKAGSLIAKLFCKDANQIVREDLRRFKQLMETGEVPTVEGQPQGSRAGR